MRSTSNNLSSLLLLCLLGPSAAQASSRSSSRRSGGGGRPSPGCSKSTTVSPNTRTNFTLPSTDPLGNNGGRPYTLWVPSSSSSSSSSSDGAQTPKPTPLIISLHGAGRTAAWQADLDRLSDPSYGFNTDHAVAYLQSTGTTDVDRFWEGYPGLSDTVDDVAYALAVLDAVVDQHLCVDLDRVYVVGKSQGGGMAGQVLACDARSAGRFAAFAAVSGAYYVPPDVVASAQSDNSSSECDPETVPLPPCDPKRAQVPLLAFHGGNDTTIAFAGGERRGYCLPAVKRWVEGWAARDGLDVEGVATSNLTSDAEVFVYGDGKDRGLTTFVYDGDRVGHDWPATFDNTDNVDHGTGPASFNASSVIMEFFRNYTLP